MKKLIKILALSFAFVLCFSACGGKSGNENVSEKPSESANGVTEKLTIPEPIKPQKPEVLKIQNFTVPEGYEKEEVVIDEKADRQQVKFTMENGAYFIVELYPEYAPETCANFVKLVEEGFYDGLTFHRVIPGFMAQGGDPTLSGRSDRAETIKGEFYINGHIKNTISHQRGVISMARTDDFNSASSQFFICYADCGYSLDAAYAAFGIVTEGMYVIDNFTRVERKLGGDGELSSPVIPIVIAKAEVIK